MEPWIIRADANLVAVWKPPAMHCAPTLADWLFARHPECASFPGLRPGEGGLLHRLDAATTGIVLFARGAAAHRAVLEAQAAGRFRKFYAARCRRAPARAAPEGWELARWEPALDALRASVSLAAARDPARSDARSDALAAARGIPLPARIRSRFRPYGVGAREVRPVPAGSARKAELRAATADEYETELDTLAFMNARVTPAANGPNALRVPEGIFEARASLLRGFRHQVRAHLAWVGLPIEGDPLYGEGFLPADAPRADVLRDGGREARLKLHALAVELPDPAGKGSLRIEAPLPEDW